VRIEDFRLKIEYLIRRRRTAADRFKKAIIKMTEQSDSHKFSIVNSPPQADPDKEYQIGSNTGNQRRL